MHAQRDARPLRGVGGRELEQTPGVALTAAVLPGVSLRSFHLGAHELVGLGSGARSGRSCAGSSGIASRA